VKSKDDVSQTPLSRAAMCGHRHEAVVKQLLEKEAGQGPRVRARWKGRRKQPLEAPFSAAISQVQRLIRKT
jgi:hypothetical protein